jgi:hypothetical protein
MTDDKHRADTIGRRSDLAGLISAHAASPDGKRRSDRLLAITTLIRDAETRRVESAKAFINAKAVVDAGKRAAQELDSARHRELVEALATASARSWRRDIIVAAIGAAFGAVATVAVSVLT